MGFLDNVAVVEYKLREFGVDLVTLTAAVKVHWVAFVVYGVICGIVGRVL